MRYNVTPKGGQSKSPLQAAGDFPSDVNELNRQAARAAAKHGFRVFPLRSKEETLKNGKLRKPKSPKITDWQKKATVKVSQIDRWSRQFPDCLFGTLTGPEAGFAVIDLDRHGDKDGFAALAAMGVTMGSIIKGKTAGGGEHHFVAADGIPTTPGVIAPGVDTKGQGGFIVIPGTVLPDGRAYAFTSGDWEALALARDIVGLPHAPTPLVSALRPRRAGSEPVEPAEDQSDIPDAVEHARKMLEIAKRRVAEAGDGKRTTTLFSEALWMGGFVACSVLSEEDAAAGLMQAAADAGMTADYDPDDLTRQIGNGLRTGAKFPILWHAPASPALFHQLWTEAELAEVEYQADYQDVIGPPKGVDESPVRTSRLTFETPDDCALSTARPYVLKGFLAAGDVGAIVGAPGVGKSLIGPRLAYAVAQGEPVFGLKTRPGPVLYVAAEDHHGMRGRVRALHQEHGAAPDFALVGGVTALFPASDDLKALCVAVKARRPSLIVIDTLAMAFPGLKENEADAMGQVVAAARALTKWGAAVVLIHHDTKDGQNGLPRGHSILNGALDVSLHLTRDGGIVRGKLTLEGSIVRGKLTKNRNGPADLDIAFTIGTKTLGQDEDGDDIKAAFARDLEPGEAGQKAERLPPSVAAALAVFRDLSGAGEPVAESDWRKACVDGRTVSGSDDGDSRRKAFKRAVEELTRKGYLSFDGQGFRGRAFPAPDNRADRFDDDEE